MLDNEVVHVKMAVHGITIMVNSLFNGWRFEEA